MRSFLKHLSLFKQFTGREIYRTKFRKCSTKPTYLGQQSSKLPTLANAGQPTHITHPHILKEGEILPGIHKQEFHERRNICFQVLKTYEPDKDHLVIFPSVSKIYMAFDVPYMFRQNTDFLYFTGCLERDCILLMTVVNGEDKTVLFMKEQTESQKLWDGPSTDVDTAISLYGIEDVRPVSELKAYLESVSKKSPDIKLWIDHKQQFGADLHAVLLEWGRTYIKRAWSIPGAITHNIRLIKSESEVNLMRKTCQIASEAIRVCMEQSYAGISEHDLHAIVDFECRMRGANFLAYPPVVAGGTRAGIIHYLRNDQLIKDGEMVLMDAGCEYYGYCSDITRTWPVNGTFSPAQTVLYDLVLQVQEEVISQCSEFLPLNYLHQNMNVSIGKKMEEAGIVKYASSKAERYFNVGNKYCPHHVSHFLGMDVHDCALIDRGITIKPGMIITIEPGIYIRPDDVHVNPEFRGISIRIEDDILITEDGAEVLTFECPKKLSAVEDIIRERRSIY